MSKRFQQYLALALIVILLALVIAVFGPHTSPTLFAPLALANAFIPHGRGSLPVSQSDSAEYTAYAARRSAGRFPWLLVAGIVALALLVGAVVLAALGGQGVSHV